MGPGNSNTIANRCRLNCRLAHLGDGVVDRGEECDDGNVRDGDGCSVAGAVEYSAAELAAIQRQGTASSTQTLAAALLSPPDAAHLGAPVIGGVFDQRSNPGLNSSGPAALAVMAAGAASGLAWMRRRRKP